MSGMALLLLIALNAAWHYRAQLDDALAPELAGTELWVRGEIASLPQRFPDHLRFLFRPSPAQAEIAGLPGLVQVRWYEDHADLQPGESWRLKLRLYPPRGLVNFQGYDREQALFTARIGAVASVLEADSLPLANAEKSGVGAIRAAVRGRVQEALPPGPGRALLLSLAIADRSELDRESWALLRITGTGHLLAISGLHVGLAAVAGFWLARSLVFVVPLFSRGRGVFLASCCGAFLAAFAYGCLAGFPVSTLRALAMLAVGLVIIAGRQGSGAMRAWLVALLVVLLIDPFAPLTPGFWLSFGAVLALIAWFAPRQRPESWWSALPRAQLAVMVVMLPLAAFWFQAGSWLALPTNLLAIPWVSFISVPLILAGLAALPLPGLSGTLLELAWWSCATLHEFLQTMAGMSDARQWLTPHAGLAATCLGLGGGMLLLLPRGLPARWLGACLLAITVLPRAVTLQQGDYRVEALDVGQGLAVVVRTRHHSLLYDTGPGDGKNWSLFGSVVAPALAADGAGRPDILVVSHGDLDHAGGLADYIARFGEAGTRWNRRPGEGGAETCHDGQSWSWDGVRFSVVHPSRWLPYLGNDSSCVISIDNGRFRTLLSGDIGSVVEQRLAPELGHHHFVTVPHHGSASSSSTEFVASAKPTWAVVSAAYGNRFGFPRDEVVARYRREDTVLLSTIECGAIRAELPRRGKPKIESARLERDRIWRWHSEPGCMARAPGKARGR